MARILYSDVGDPTRPSGGGKDFSSRVVYEPWRQWAENNLASRLWHNAPDLGGVEQSNVFGPWDPFLGADYSSAFGASWYAWRANALAEQLAYAAAAPPWSEGQSWVYPPYLPSLAGLDLTADSLARFLALAAVGPNAPYLPQVVTGADGQKYVRYNQAEKDSGGWLDKLTAKFEPALALSGFAGPALGASIAAAPVAAGAGLSAGELMALDIATGGLGGAGAIDAATGAIGLGASGAGGASLSALNVLEEAGNFTGGGEVASEAAQLAPPAPSPPAPAPAPSAPPALSKVVELAGTKAASFLVSLGLGSLLPRSSPGPAIDEPAAQPAVLPWGSLLMLGGAAFVIRKLARSA